MFTKKMNLEDRLINHIALQTAAQKQPDCFGIEVELEGKGFLKPPPDVKKYWYAHNDNSLRKLNEGDETVEYKSREPFNMQNTAQAVELLFDYLTSPGVEVYDSYRTSIHVHVNYGCEKGRTIYNAIVISIILDELLTSQNGEHRIGNNFCLRAKDALGQVTALITSINNGNGFYGISPNERYSSINFASLMKFGSIEYRSLECTLHKGRLNHWIGTLQQIKEAAKTFTNPIGVIRQFSIWSPKEFLSIVLGPYAIKYLNVDGAEEMLHNGMRIAQDFAYSSEWNEIDYKAVEEAEKMAAYMKMKKDMMEP